MSRMPFRGSKFSNFVHQVYKMQTSRLRISDEDADQLINPSIDSADDDDDYYGNQHDSDKGVIINTNFTFSHSSSVISKCHITYIIFTIIC